MYGRFPMAGFTRDSKKGVSRACPPREAMEGLPRLCRRKGGTGRDGGFAGETPRANRRRGCSAGVSDDPPW